MYSTWGTELNEGPPGWASNLVCFSMLTKSSVIIWNDVFEYILTNYQGPLSQTRAVGHTE